MGVSKNRGTPKWMVYNGKNPIKIDDLGGGFPYFWFNTHTVYVSHHRKRPPGQKATVTPGNRKPTALGWNVPPMVGVELVVK